MIALTIIEMPMYSFKYYNSTCKNQLMCFKLNLGHYNLA